MSAMTRQPLFSAVLPALNEASSIERALASVSEFDEVIVVDGGSDDETRNIVKSMGATLVEADAGRGRQLRQGAIRSKGDILVFLHSDNWLSKNALGELRQLVERRQGRPVFGCFRQKIEGQGWLYRLVERGNAFRARRLSMPYGDQAVFVDRVSYQQVGGFDPVPLMEDVILSRQLRRLCSPFLLKGPVHVSARRWSARGVLLQTLQNWLIFTAFTCGVSPQTLAKWYR